MIIDNAIAGLLALNVPLDSGRDSSVTFAGSRLGLFCLREPPARL